MDFYWMQLFLVWISYSIPPLTNAIHETPPVCNDSVTTNCLLLFEDEVAFNIAEEDCASLGGHLPAVYSDDFSNLLGEVADSRGIERAWIGGWAQTDDVWDWNWFHGQTFLTYQGCFSDDLSNDFYVQQSEEILTVDGCLESCIDDRMGYAALSYSNNELGCLCGSDFSLDSATEGCDIACPSDGGSYYYDYDGGSYLTYCGSENSLAVYRVDFGMDVGAAYANWASFALDKESKFCAALDRGASYQWKNEHCDKEYPYICQYSYGPEDCIDDDDDDLIWTGGICISIHQNRRQWYGMVRNCISRGGAPLRIDDPSQQAALEDALPEATPGDPSDMYWIGLTRWRWIWVHDGSRIGEYSYFSQPAPWDQDTSRGCLVVASQHGYRWLNVNCARSYPYFCVLGNDSYHHPTTSPQDESVGPTGVNHESGSISEMLTVAITVGSIIALLLVMLIMILIHRWYRSQAAKRASHPPNNQAPGLILKRMDSNLDFGETYDYIDNNLCENTNKKTNVDTGLSCQVQPPEAPPVPRSPRPGSLKREFGNKAYVGDNADASLDKNDRTTPTYLEVIASDKFQQRNSPAVRLPL